MSRPIIGYIVDAATRLFTSRRIGGVLFDGTKDINLPGVNEAGTQNTSGNAATATRLQTNRSFGITGDGTAAAVNFNGTANVNLTLQLTSITTARTVGSNKKIPIITIDAKGRVTTINEVAVVDNGSHDVNNSVTTIAANSSVDYNVITLLGSNASDYDITKLSVDVTVLDTDDGSPTKGLYINSETVVVVGVSEDRKIVKVHNNSGAPVSARVRISVGMS